MKGIYANNVGMALIQGTYALKNAGVTRPSRNGPTIEFDAPVTTTYQNPTQRVVFWPERDANPFFHFFEALWMISGRNDNEFVCHFNKGMANYSDDGKTQNGAYGHRWRTHFGYDQLEAVIRRLLQDPMDRRVVLQMWHPMDLVNFASKDVPCNTNVYFSLRSGKLDMTVCNRSNDMIWGAYGANAVHFSMLQEYVAGMVSAEVGLYHQVSNNLHAYTENEVWQRCLNLKEKYTVLDCPYGKKLVKPYEGMVKDPYTWDAELEVVMGIIRDAMRAEPGDKAHTHFDEFENPFFREVVIPMWNCWDSWKRGEKQAALDDTAQIAATDWQLAAKEWFERRLNKPAAPVAA